MSLDIATVDPRRPEAAASATVATSARAVATDPGGVDGPVRVETFPSHPPPEVLDAIATAAQASARLTESGRELRFRVNPRGGGVTVEVRDLQGNLCSTVPPSAALDVAAGGSLD
jgi:hypothetical protein